MSAYIASIPQRYPLSVSEGVLAGQALRVLRSLDSLSLDRFVPRDDENDAVIAMPISRGNPGLYVRSR